MVDHYLASDPNKHTKYMPIANDGDIVRGLGDTTLYAAYMEEAIDECRVALMKRDPVPPKGIEKWGISKRVE